MRESGPRESSSGEFARTFMRRYEYPHLEAPMHQEHGLTLLMIVQNEFLKEHLQPEIVPALLEQGIVRPLRQKIVEGDTLLDRAQNALNLLRQRNPSGERLVWRVST